jgi:hypothetical protein
MELSAAFKTLAAIIATLSAAGAVAWGAGQAAVAPVQARVSVIELDHGSMRQQITSAEVAAKNAENLSEYNAKMLQNILIIQGQARHIPDKPSMWRVRPDGQKVQVNE